MATLPAVGVLVAAFNMAQPAATVHATSPCEYHVGDHSFAARCGVLELPVDHLRRADSGRIELPFMLVGSSDSADTVLALGGGPGISNMAFPIPGSLLTRFNVLLVGYRGIDHFGAETCSAIDDLSRATPRLLSPDSLVAFRRTIAGCFERMEASALSPDLINPQQTIADMRSALALLNITNAPTDRAVHILAGSFGTRLALYFAANYPSVVQSMALVAPNPPGGTVWEPESINRTLEAFGLTDTDKVLNRLRERWLGFAIDPDRIRISTFAMLYATDSAALAATAWRGAAAEDDLSGLALLSLSYDWMVAGTINWPHALLMAGSVDFDSKRNYNRELAVRPGSFGSPLGQLLWNMVPGSVPMLSPDFRNPLPLHHPTLVVTGDLDVSAPRSFVVDTLLPHLTDHHHLQVSNAGHYDLWRSSVSALVVDYLSGQSIPQHLELPAPEAPKLSLTSVARLGLIAAVAVAIIVLLIATLVWKRIRRESSR